MILQKEMTERMFHHSLVSFYIALQYCLSVSVPVCVLFVPTVGPMGQADHLLPFHSRFWALTLKPKKRRRKTQDIQTKKENLLNSAIVCFVSTSAKITTLSCLLTMMILPKQYL